MRLHDYEKEDEGTWPAGWPDPERHRSLIKVRSSPIQMLPKPCSLSCVTSLCECEASGWLLQVAAMILRVMVGHPRIKSVFGST